MVTGGAGYIISHTCVALLPRANPYGETKVVSEVVLKDCAAVAEDSAEALLRYFNPVGAHQSGLIGEEPRGMLGHRARPL